MHTMQPGLVKTSRQTLSQRCANVRAVGTARNQHSGVMSAITKWHLGTSTGFINLVRRIYTCTCIDEEPQNTRSSHINKQRGALVEVQ